LLYFSRYCWKYRTAAPRWQGDRIEVDMPPPKFGGPPVTNIRNAASPYWRGWLKPESRCLVPANSSQNTRRSRTR
jgi:putative SOS response-associated peptidase YedK